ncbi:hypothetical protein IWQ48_001300 [Labrenzia sp. EL_13]|nr:hypothetical protein [Labrenzia sp. EL_13]
MIGVEDIWKIAANDPVAPMLTAEDLGVTPAEDAARLAETLTSQPAGKVITEKGFAAYFRSSPNSQNSTECFYADFASIARSSGGSSIVISPAINFR